MKTYESTQHSDKGENSIRKLTILGWCVSHLTIDVKEKEH